MTQDEADSPSRIDRDELIKTFYERYPRLSRVLASFRQNPLSGNTLRLLIRGEQEVERHANQVHALEPPIMWQRTAPIVISQYGSYASDQLPRYWNATVPDIQERYGNIMRYEHHDVPNPNTSLTDYKLATVGRAIQHQAGNEAFWSWFDTLMVDGVKSVTEAYDLAETLELDVERSYLETAVQEDLYGSVIWDDIYSLMGKSDETGYEELAEQLENSEPVFAVFVNGIQVPPSYDSIVGVIEEIRTQQSQAAVQAQAVQQQRAQLKNEHQQQQRVQQRRQRENQQQPATRQNQRAQKQARNASQEEQGSPPKSEEQNSPIRQRSPPSNPNTIRDQNPDSSS